MVTTDQYPHILQNRDAFGAWVDVCICRDEPNDKGKPMPMVDGVAYIYSSLIYLPNDTEKFLKGEDVRVYDEAGDERVNANVKRFSRDTYHSRIWV